MMVQKREDLPEECGGLARGPGIYKDVKISLVPDVRRIFFFFAILRNSDFNLQAMKNDVMKFYFRVLTPVATGQRWDRQSKQEVILIVPSGISESLN